MSGIYFVKKDSLHKKLAIFATLCLSYAVGLWVYHNVDFTRPSFKPYYMKSYFAAAEYQLSDSIKSFSAPFAASAVNYSSDSLSAQSVPVLLYHGLLDKTDGSNPTLDEFISHMEALKKAGYQTVSVEDLKAFLDGTKKLPEKSFVLTFDDGRKDSYYPADPMLKALGYKAVMFTIGKPRAQAIATYYLSPTEVKAMADSSQWEVESHTMTHRDLLSVPPQELPTEIVDSKTYLEGQIGKPIIAFAFPFGEFGEHAVDVTDESSITTLAKQTYALSFYQYSTNERFSQNYPAGSDANHLVKRIEVRPGWSANKLLSVIASGQAKDLPFSAQFDDSDGWTNTFWGDMELENNALLVRSIASTTGSAAILDGSKLWKDYEVDATVRWLAGSNIYLWARYQDDKNYVACNFEHGLVHVEVTKDGVRTVLKGSSADVPVATGRPLDISMRVTGRDAACLINGNVAVETPYIDDSLSTGGVGIKTWDRTPGVSSLEIDKYSVQPI